MTENELQTMDATDSWMCSREGVWLRKADGSKVSCCGIHCCAMRPCIWQYFSPAYRRCGWMWNSMWTLNLVCEFIGAERKLDTLIQQSHPGSPAQPNNVFAWGTKVQLAKAIDRSIRRDTRRDPWEPGTEEQGNLYQLMTVLLGRSFMASGWGTERPLWVVVFPH